MIADKAYSAGTYRRSLHVRGIKVVIPEKSDEIAARRRRGSRGGRPRGLDTTAYQRRNVVERHVAVTRQWRGLATRYDKLAITYRAAVVLAAHITWTRIWETRPSGRRRSDQSGTTIEGEGRWASSVFGVWRAGAAWLA